MCEDTLTGQFSRGVLNAEEDFEKWLDGVWSPVVPREFEIDGKALIRHEGPEIGPGHFLFSTTGSRYGQEDSINRCDTGNSVSYDALSLLCLTPLSYGFFFPMSFSEMLSAVQTTT